MSGGHRCRMKGWCACAGWVAHGVSVRFSTRVPKPDGGNQNGQSLAAWPVLGLTACHPAGHPHTARRPNLHSVPVRLRPLVRGDGSLAACRTPLTVGHKCGQWRPVEASAWGVCRTRDSAARLRGSEAAPTHTVGHKSVASRRPPRCATSPDRERMGRCWRAMGGLPASVCCASRACCWPVRAGR